MDPVGLRAERRELRRPGNDRAWARGVLRRGPQVRRPGARLELPDLDRERFERI